MLFLKDSILWLNFYKVIFNCLNLQDYLSHPVKQHMLIRNLPSGVRNKIMHQRKYIFTIHEVATRLVLFSSLALKRDFMIDTRLLKKMWVLKKERGFFFSKKILSPLTMKIAFPKSDLLLLGRNGHFKFTG